MVAARPRSLPRLTINLFSGGKHAGQQISVQDVLIVPMSAETLDPVQPYGDFREGMTGKMTAEG